jgi:hypothetical protein
MAHQHLSWTTACNLSAFVSENNAIGICVLTRVSSIILYIQSLTWRKILQFLCVLLVYILRILRQILRHVRLWRQENICKEFHAKVNKFHSVMLWSSGLRCRVLWEVDIHHLVDLTFHKFCSCFLAGPCNRIDVGDQFWVPIREKQFIISQRTRFKCLCEIRQAQ